MTNETAKANERRKKSYLFDKVFSGHGIDIGCGWDLLNKDNAFPNIGYCEPFDIEQGDAQTVNKFRPKSSFDFVYSSNCLEHMEDPQLALKNWFSLVKPGGYLVLVVPDEDLYEQGHFPSIYNKNHTHTFTIDKSKSWSSKSINIIELLKTLSPIKILKIELVDDKYDYSLKNIDQTRGDAEAFIEVIIKKISEEE